MVYWNAHSHSRPVVEKKAFHDGVDSVLVWRQNLRKSSVWHIK